MITFSCTCGKIYCVDDKIGGCSVRCRQCKSVLTVPAVEGVSCATEKFQPNASQLDNGAAVGYMPSGSKKCDDSSVDSSAASTPTGEYDCNTPRVTVDETLDHVPPGQHAQAAGNSQMFTLEVIS
jgi:hypothetical protein